MLKRLLLLQALAILIAVFRFGMRAERQDAGRNSSNPYLTTRYVQNPVEFMVSGDVLITTTTWTCSRSLQLHNPAFTSCKSLAKWNSVPILCIPSLQDTSCMFWCWWVARNNWSKKLCSCSCTSTTQLQNASVDGSSTNTHWDRLYLWKGELIYIYTICEPIELTILLILFFLPLLYK